MTTSHSAETLLIEGPDAIAFAHAQFSSKVNLLAPGHWQFSAWLSAQGRVRAVFHVCRIADDRLLLLLRGGDAALIAAALRPFVFRSRLTITARTAQWLTAAPAQPLHSLHEQAQGLCLGCGTHSLLIDSSDTVDDSWQLSQLRLGWPWLPAAALDALLPTALSLQRIEAVAIDKGCYPGQEIVARLHYRGGHKQHLHGVELSRPENSGAALRNPQGEVGRLLDVIVTDSGIKTLAVINDSFAAQAVDEQLGPLENGLMLRLDASWPA
ncbi:MAG: folate-binding protein [Rhodanobacter sp.]|nr:MAG: folate-binding protein [Rhodanobacter sp.]